MNDKLTDYKKDDRPQRGGWAPGKYACQCRVCDCGFIGDKRAYLCADCAYAQPMNEKHDDGMETHLAMEIAKELKREFRIKLNCSNGEPSAEYISDKLSSVLAAQDERAILAERRLGEMREVLEKCHQALKTTYDHHNIMMLSCPCSFLGGAALQAAEGLLGEAT